MSTYYNPHLKTTAQKLMKDLTENELKEVVDFIEFIKEKDKKIRKAQSKKISLQGFINNSSVTDEDLEEVKKIWK